MTWLLLLAAAVYAMKPLYDPKTSYVTPISELNFEKQINKIRQTTKYVTIVHYYRKNDGESKAFARSYDEFTNEYKGIFRIAACDCDESERICKKENVNKYPTIRVYPPYPVPSIDLESGLDVQEIIKLASKYIHNNVIEINDANVNTFVSENPTVPKVLLFSEKKGFPLVFKGLSVEFEKKMTFGIVRHTEKALLDRFNVKTFPKMLLIKANEKRPYNYDGEYKFKSMFDFLNIHSEVFVPGGGSAADSAATKEWLTQMVPQLHQKSANDICLKVDQVICVILINANATPDNAQIDQLKELSQEYQRQINRGVVFKFMWMDASVEKKLANTFKFEGQPKIVLLNPGKKKRYTVHEGEHTRDALRSTLDRVSGGDARFVRLEDLPDFAPMN